MENEQKTSLRLPRMNLHSLRVKVTLAVAACVLALLIFSLWLLNASMTQIEHDLIDDRLTSDIRYMRDELGNDWSVRSGALYCGGARIGDGQSINYLAEARMMHLEEVTGTFYYTFIRTYNDSELVWTGDRETGYQQGHFLRTAGTTKGPHGENIVGTYMSKDVADILDAEGVYSGEANVNGRMIYCRYETLNNAEGEVVGAIVVGRSIEEMRAYISGRLWRGVALDIIALVVLSFVLYELILVLLRSIAQIRERLQLIGTGAFPEEPLRLKTHDEMSQIADSINEMVDSLKERQRMGAELSVAADIQANMLPREFPAHEAFEISALMDPAKEVGGDFYDFYKLDDHRLVITIADVSGKGVPAAMFMVVARTLLKTQLLAGMSPAEAFTSVNRALCEGNDADLFVTSWTGVLDLDTGLLTYVNAGHNPPMLRRGDGSYAMLRSKVNLVLAAVDDIVYSQYKTRLAPGDRLLLYTDGVTEATSVDKQLYGEERLMKYLNSHTDAAVSELLTGVRADIDLFVGEAEQFDDITMLGLYYLRNGESGKAEN